MLRRFIAALRTKVYLLQLPEEGNVIRVRATRVVIEHGVLQIYYGRTLSAAYQHNRWKHIVHEGCPANAWFPEERKQRAPPS
jgi:hypothetical protein